VLVRQHAVDQQERSGPKQNACAHCGAGPPFSRPQGRGGLQAWNNQRKRTGGQHDAGSEAQQGIVHALRRLPGKQYRQGTKRSGQGRRTTPHDCARKLGHVALRGSIDATAQDEQHANRDGQHQPP